MLMNELEKLNEFCHYSVDVWKWTLVFLSAAAGRTHWLDTHNNGMNFLFCPFSAIGVTIRRLSAQIDSSHFYSKLRPLLIFKCVFESVHVIH